jgi:1-deoxy-D-xylulose-5-phosphate synthase
MSLMADLKTPQDCKSLTPQQMEVLAGEIREFLIDSISKSGGHIGANLGVIELTIALHYVFDFGERGLLDRLLFDVGHQGYTHKILTGRKEMFSSLNSVGGMSRFISDRESPFDSMDASHGGTAISIGVGLAMSKWKNEEVGKIVVVVGDGAFGEGMSMEALNFAPEYPLPLVIVINDNGMSIPPSIGGFNKIFSNDDWQSNCKSWFEGLGFKYVSVEDGHDISALTDVFGSVSREIHPVVVHVKTHKGKGLSIADDHPYKLHFSLPFDPVTGDGVSAAPTGKTFTKVVEEELRAILSNNGQSYVLTPSTPYASGIESLLEEYPNRVFDVGMAEQHAVGMAAGLSMAGNEVYACFQSTFLQRSIDQLIHDLCWPNRDVTIISSRSGFAGFDGPTHHGIYDNGLLASLPGLKVFYAGTESDLRDILRARSGKSLPTILGPLVILHPYEAIPPLIEIANYKSSSAPLTDCNLVSVEGDDLIVTTGNCLMTAFELQDELAKRGSNFSIVDLRWISPLPEESLGPLLARAQKVIVIEEGFVRTGIGVRLCEFAHRRRYPCHVLVNAIECDFCSAGDKLHLLSEAKIDTESILARAKNCWGI